MTLKLHPRTLIVQAARLEFDRFLIDLEQKHDLTHGELFSLLGHAVATLANHQVRSERHPEDPERQGDEA